ncbi:ABC transporter substrate binding protein [Rhodoplanes sp. Z2-YC6860]|nr:ABC transporter substrate binding protein [Rhodoplanes sp. Z2-YC6860]
MAGSLVARPLVAPAQQVDKVFRLGQLHAGTVASRAPMVAAFMQGMREFGYIEGQNLLVARRYADGRFERLPSLMRELLAWGPDVVLVSTTPGNLAAKAATLTLPIVMVSVADPIGAGLIASLAQPGGNITGVTNIGAELAGKRLEILKEIVPTASKVAVFINPADQNATLQMNSARPAAEKLALQLEPILEIRSGADLKGAFEAAIRARADAAVRMLDPVATDLRHQTVQLAAEYRLPVIYAFREDVAAGGLASYGSNLPSQYRQAATFVHKIFNGSKPADLPVEQPTKFDLAINLKAANALGLVVPPTLLARADEVIE